MTPTTALWITTLLSGAAGAVAAAAISWGAMHLLDARNKAWALKAELRRHRVSRLVIANDGLRTCFFLALTQLEYHLLALGSIENAQQRPGHNNFQQDELKHHRIREMERYNEQIGATEAAARAHAAFLNEELIPLELRAEIQKMLGALIGSNTTDAASIQARINFFNQNTSEVIRLLTEVDNLISREISRPLQ